MASFSLFLAILACISGAFASYQFYNFTTASTNLTSLCVGVLNLPVDCDPALEWAGQGRFEDDETLGLVCTPACTFALETWLGRATKACKDRYVDRLGNAILPAYYVESILENYNILCLKNGDNLCNSVLRNGFGINPDNQSKTKSSVSTVTCDDCFLKQMQTKLQMPLMSNTDLASTFASLTSACRKTNFAVTPPATSTAWIVSTTTPGSSVLVPTPSGCAGTLYTIRRGDTCHSIALSQGVSTVDLLGANDRLAFCRDFPSQGRVCIRSDAKCRTRTVKENDTCEKIADEVGVTWTQIVTWNPLFGIGCKGIKNYVGFTMCVSTPGGDWVDPSPQPTTPTSTFTLPPFIGTEASLLPAPTMAGMINGSDIWTFRFAKGTRMDCAAYANGTDFTSGASCDTVASKYGSTAAELIHWNPSLSESSCKLDGQLTYCVRQVTLRSQNMTQYCTLEDIPSPGIDCDSFIDLWSLDKETFAAFNPAVGSNCENWALGQSYCVFARHFRQPGIIATCNKWDMANETNHLDDPCGIFEAKHGLTHGRFVAWNPMVHSDCTGIQRYNDYCVSVPGFVPTYTSKKPATTQEPN